MPIPDTDVAALKSKYGNVQQLDVAGHTLVIRKPNRIEYRRVRGLINEDKNEQAIEAMLLCVVWPESPKVEAILDELPALETKLTDAVFAFAGLSSPIEKKDL